VLKPPQSRRCALANAAQPSRSVWTAAVDRRFRPPEDIVWPGSIIVCDAPQKKKAGTFQSRLCFVEIFSLTPGFSRVRKVCEEKKPFKRFFFGAFVVHRVKTRC
jgi:hypothetical protein